MLFSLESALRELIIETLERIAGPRWYRKRLPGATLDQFRTNLATDRASRWTNNIPHHPIYYLGFPDLRATIEQRENWSGAFAAIFPRNKDLVTTDLIELEFIRNKVAHNRLATAADQAIVETARAKLSTAIGPDYFRDLSMRHTVETMIPEHLEELKREADISFALCARGRKLVRFDTWRRANDQWWWFDDMYLAHSLGRINSFFRSLEEYKRLWDETSGSGLEAWATTMDVKRLYAAAELDLRNVIGRWRGVPSGQTVGR